MFDLECRSTDVSQSSDEHLIDVLSADGRHDDKSIYAGDDPTTTAEPLVMDTMVETDTFVSSMATSHDTSSGPTTIQLVDEVFGTCTASQEALHSDFARCESDFMP